MSAAAGYTGLAAFGWLTLFQMLLVAGFPLGRFAWGGAFRVLPGRLRLASLLSAAVSALGALVVAQAAGLMAPLFPDGRMELLLWAFTGLFGLSLFANLFGAKRGERLHGAPLALICFLSSAVLALD